MSLNFMKFRLGFSALESPKEANSSPSPERLLGARLKDFLWLHTIKGLLLLLTCLDLYSGLEALQFQISACFSFAAQGKVSSNISEFWTNIQGQSCHYVTT